MTKLRPVWVLHAERPGPGATDVLVGADAYQQALDIINEVLIPGIIIEGGGKIVVLSANAAHEMGRRIERWSKAQQGLDIALDVLGKAKKNEQGA